MIIFTLSSKWYFSIILTLSQKSELISSLTDVKSFCNSEQQNYGNCALKCYYWAALIGSIEFVSISCNIYNYVPLGEIITYLRNII